MHEHDGWTVAAIADGNGHAADLDFFHAVFPLVANKSQTDMIGNRDSDKRGLAFAGLAVAG
jgi:hypothetical protein